MRKMMKEIENYIQLHTSDMNNEEYAELMRGLAEWATGQADAAEYLEEHDTIYPIED